MDIKELVDKLNCTVIYDKESVLEKYEEEGIELRICSKCNKFMSEGYCFDGGTEYYCSDECLHKDFTDSEWMEEYESNDDSYWTEWN